MKIITAEERLAQVRKPKILLTGPYGVGKTTQLTTLDPKTTLFADLESGDLAVQDFPCDHLRLDSWPECRNLAAFLGGVDKNVASGDTYGAQHVQWAEAWFHEHAPNIKLAKYETYFIDSITVASRWCLAWALQQPESFNKQGERNTLGAYGLLAREMVAWLTQLQRADVTVVFSAILEQSKDEFERSYWGLQLEGGKVGRELPGIVDQVVTMQFVPVEGEALPQRRFVCRPENPKAYPAKDRSGRLEMIEPANLGQLIRKLTAKPATKQRAA